MLLNLLKLEFLAMLNSFSGGKKAKKKKTALWGSIILMLVLGAYFMVMGFIFNLSMNSVMMMIGEPDFAITMMFFAVSIVSLTYTLLKSSSILFTFKDFDLLFSMPIKASTIIQSKVLFLYFSNFLFKLVIMLPAVVSWVIITSPTVLQIILVVISIPFINLIPMVIAAFFGFIVSYISSFFRKSALFNTIFSILGVVLIFSLSLGFNLMNQSLITATETSADSMAQTIDSINSYYPLTNMFFEIAKGDIVSFVIFISMSILVFVAFSIFVGKNFLKIRTRLNSQSVKRKAVEIKSESRSHLKTIIDKEFKLLITTPIYAMNILTGLIMGFMIVGYVIYLNISQPEVILFAIEYSSIINPIIPFVLSFVVGYVATTSCSISLEGRNLWLLKAMPIKASTIFMGKCIFNFILQMPVAILMGAISAYVLKSNILWALVFILIPITMCVLNTFISLLLNIQFPMLEWENPAVPVKRGAPIMIMVFVNLAVYMGGGFIAFLLLSESSQLPFFIGTFIVVNIANVIMYLYINKNAEKILLDIG